VLHVDDGKDLAITQVRWLRARQPQSLSVIGTTGRPDAEVVLSRYEKAAERWQAPLMAELGKAGSAMTLIWWRGAGADESG
jgi:hypothetical protein